MLRQIGHPSAVRIVGRGSCPTPCVSMAIGLCKAAGKRERADLDGERLEPPHADSPRQQHLELRGVGRAPPVIRHQIRRILVLTALASSACV